MHTDSLNVVYFDKDTSFDSLFPKRIQGLSERHWTPLEIARKSCEYLSVPNSKVLDIGSGVGKFCITAGFYGPETLFYGVEQRKDLYNIAEGVKNTLDLQNVNFIHKNITELDFGRFDSFYFFNSFYENIKPDLAIDTKIEATAELYSYYTDYVREQLDQRPSGTRLVTYHGSLKQVPTSYKLIDNSYNYALKMWMRE
ncbi:methyltransferase domain-containing protein [Pedobacter suwonensis]|uniref:methyltransferase domain-containing protein n=1 Tax=Pedobacter suwonensis TaxID=332999 RepID=UPI0036A9E79A